MAITRSKRTTMAFAHAFSLTGADHSLPPGDDEIVTDEEWVEELSFPVYRRVSTLMSVPAPSNHPSSSEMPTVDAAELRAAYERDQAVTAANGAAIAVSPGPQTGIRP